jgi:hypothetical protein
MFLLDDGGVKEAVEFCAWKSNLLGRPIRKKEVDKIEGLKGSVACAVERCISAAFSWQHGLPKHAVEKIVW